MQAATLATWRESLSGRPNKELTLQLAHEAMTDIGTLESLYALLYDDSESLRWRAAWVLEKVSLKQPSLLYAERARLTELAMRTDISDGLRRLLLSICYHMPDAKECDVRFYNFLLDTMVNLQSSAGVQALAMKLAARMSCVDNILHDEFQCIIRNMEMEYYSPGVRAAIRNCMKMKKVKKSKTSLGLNHYNSL